MAGTWQDIAAQNRRTSAIRRVARSVAWERISQPRPTDLSRVPPSPEALTPEFLTAVMCKGHAGAKVEKIILGEESSGSGNRRAFSVVYNDAGNKAGLPQDLFHKGVHDFYTRLNLVQNGIVRNEPLFYTKILPYLSLETPHPYYAEIEERTNRICIILDDIIKQKRAAFFTVSSAVSRDDAGQMVDILSHLHGTFWEKKSLAGLEWLLTPNGFNRYLLEGMEYQKLTQNGVRRSLAVLPKTIVDNQDAMWRAFLNAMILSDTGPATVIHGDPHLRNFYKLPDGKVGLADWQVTMWGSWGHDFAYTVLTSLTPENRRAWERDLLAQYLEGLKKHGANAPSLDAAWEHYRRQTMYTLVGWLVTIGFGELQPSMQPDSESMEIIRRAAIAVEDLGSIKALTN